MHSEKASEGSWSGAARRCRGDHIKGGLPDACETVAECGCLLRGDFEEVRRYVAASVRPTLRPFRDSQMPASPGRFLGSTCSRHHTAKATQSVAREAYDVSDAPSKPPSMAAAAASNGCMAHTDCQKWDVSLGECPKLPPLQKPAVVLQDRPGM